MTQYPQQFILTNPGGIFTALDVTAPAVVKPAPGAIMKVIPLAVGTSGNLTINDLASTSGDAPSNEIVSIPFSNMTQGVPLSFEARTLTGIAVTSVPTGGRFTITYY